ncbi:MAG: hypothetical protein AAF585_25240 [Verrucomicrobiota bacterium]
MRRFLLLCFFSCLGTSVAEFVPDSVSEEDFEHVNENSPFTRPLNLSSSLRLLGVLKVGGRSFATVMDEETEEIHTISDQPNPRGWKLVEVSGGDIKETTATIAIGASEFARIRFGAQQLDPKANPKLMNSMKLNVVKQRDLPKGYDTRWHQKYVDHRMKSLSDQQKKRIHELWTAKQKAEPQMRDRGQQFVRIMEFVAGGER